MKIVINLTKHEVKHLLNCDSYYDSCQTVSDVMEKVKESIDNELDKQERNKR